MSGNTRDSFSEESNSRDESGAESEFGPLADPVGDAYGKLPVTPSWTSEPYPNQKVVRAPTPEEVLEIMAKEDALDNKITTSAINDILTTDTSKKYEPQMLTHSLFFAFPEAEEKPVKGKCCTIL